MFFLKNVLLYPRAWFRQTKYIAKMTKERSSKIVNFMTPGAGVHVLGCGHISHIKCIIFNSINIQLIDCYCVKGLQCNLSLPLLIFLYCIVRRNAMQILSLMTIYHIGINNKRRFLRSTAMIFCSIT